MKFVSSILAFSVLLLVSSCIGIEFSSGSSSNSGSSSGSSLAASYIGQFKQIAIEERRRAGVPASIKLAQAILESGYGRSELSTKANNHFGIKCGGNWNGDTYELKSKKACFRAYKNAEESFRHHSDFLRDNSRYAALFKLKITDYKGWARGLQKAGYATDPSYPSKLIELIERYQLHQYDR